MKTLTIKEIEKKQIEDFKNRLKRRKQKGYLSDMVDCINNLEEIAKGL